MSEKFQLALTTAITLVEQFQQALTSPPTGSTLSTELSGKDALPLLSASSTALKAQTTKLSLLAITTPFTHSAVASVLTDLNGSVLPSLVSAALLVTPDDHTKAFQTEVRGLAKTTLKEIRALLTEVQTVADKKAESKKGSKKEANLSQSEKDTVTVATGRAWDSCDVLIDISAKGVVGFVVRRVQEWRDLVRDAVEEIDEWDPEEDGDEFFDELLSDDGKDATNKDSDEGSDDDEEDNAALHEQKKITLRILKPVSQIYPVISNRLKKTTDSPSIAKELESLMEHMQHIPEDVDEVAGALYEADWERCVQHLLKTKERALNSMNLVTTHFNASETVGGQQAADDKFATWTKTWLRVMDEVTKGVADFAASD